MMVNDSTAVVSFQEYTEDAITFQVSRHGHLEVVCCELLWGMDYVNVSDKDDETALIWGSRGSRLDVIRVLTKNWLT